MRSRFFVSMAAGNIKKNAKMYVPYLLACTLTTAMFYIITSLSWNKDLKKMPVGADEIQILLSLGTGIVAFFALVFLFYINSFLMKRRKKEFGLFNILGMEKRHIGRIIAWESILTAASSMVVGLFFGVLLDKLMFLILLNIFQAEDVALGFHVSWKAAAQTAILFGVLYLLLYVDARRQIHLAKPIELLRSQNQGEKEPKARWVAAFLGVACLLGGYYISVTSTNPLAAFGLFFLAVILVIVGTYLFFLAGSVAWLKLLKKKKSYYYKANHFISVSGMIYRMKQNAVGLANICILSTMVLVMLSSTLSLHFGIKEALNEKYPREMTVACDEKNMEQNKQFQVIQEILNKEKVEKKNYIGYSYLGFSAVRDKDEFQVKRDEWKMPDLRKVSNLFFITLDDYNKNNDTKETLEKDEIFIYGNQKPYREKSLHIFEDTFQIKEELNAFQGDALMASNVASSYFIVVEDQEILADLYEKQKAAYGKEASEIKNYMAFDMTGEQEEKDRVYETLKIKLEETGVGNVDFKDAAYDSFLSLYSGFLFIGIFLSILFVMAAILIIYYKQITEGYEDKERYEIMQKVGLGEREVKRAINSQILTVFFLPLIMAAVHIVFAFPIIKRLLATLYLTDTKLYMTCTVGCFAVFALIYVLIYKITARTYYSIVKR